MEEIMKLSAPKNITFYIAAGLGVIGIIGLFIPAMEAFAAFILAAGFLVLAAGNLFENI
jgi:uncharacterized membrane protein YbaN (DUF454 family)